MVAPVPTQVSKLPRRIHVASTRTKQLPPSSPSYAPRYALIASALNSLRILPVTTGVYLETVPSDRPSGSQTHKLFCLHRLAASLPSLSTLFCTRSLCFQSFAASFPKTPGWGVPLRRALHRQPQRTRNGNGKSYCYRLARRHPIRSGESFVTAGAHIPLCGWRKPLSTSGLLGCLFVRGSGRYFG
jgi:hypothetical protein